MRIAVLGGGAWGTALAQTQCLSGRETVLWARSMATVNDINERHANETYLPGVKLALSLKATHSLAEALAGSDIVLVVTPAQATRVTLAAMRPLIGPSAQVLLCAKGLEQSSGLRLSTIAAEILPSHPVAVLSGPGFAAEVVRGLPTAVTLASADATLGAELAQRLGSQSFRIYWTADITGVEIGGAVKNVLAIAAGILDGRQLGASAHAALVTRGFAELRRFAAAAGADPATLMGLSGLGDLMLTCSSPMSRNMSLGRALGQGRPLAEVLAGRRSVAEGVATSVAVAREARRQDIDMPIAMAVSAILAGTLHIDEAIAALLSRPFKAED